jgi:hypothetical protein
MDPMILALRSLRRRLLLVQWARVSVTALLYMFCLACVWLVLTRLFPRLGDPQWVAVGLAFAGLVGASAWAVWRRPSLLKAALEADKRLGLEERLTSSLQLSDQDGPMVQAVHDDARQQLERLNYQREFPLSAPRSVRWLAVPLILYMAGYVLLPTFDLFGHEKRIAEAKAKEAAVRVEAERLREAVRPLREAAELGRADLDGLVKSIESIALGLEKGEVTEKQAVARITNLAKELHERREKLGVQQQTPQDQPDLSKFSITKDMATNFQKGNYAEAAQKLGELKEKLKSDQQSGEEKKKLANELKQLSNLMGGDSSELGKALAELASSMELEEGEGSVAEMEKLELSIEDIQSLLEQLDQMKKCEGKLAECKKKLYCAKCGGMCKGGDCKGVGFLLGEGNGFGEGLGMRGPGRGRGNRIGELPEVDGQYDAQLLPGDMTKGKILAGIMQRAAPTEEAESTIEYTEQALIQVKQQTEEALTREEIPAGAREFVRQYFGSLEPEGQESQTPETSQQ